VIFLAENYNYTFKFVSYVQSTVGPFFPGHGVYAYTFVDCNPKFRMHRPEDKNKAKPTPNSASDVSEGDRRQRRRDQCSRCGHHHSHHHHQHHHHRGDRYSRSGTSCEHCDDCSVDNNAGVCSNRMVQIAVIVLVLIMAIW